MGIFASIVVLVSACAVAFLALSLFVHARAMLLSSGNLDSLNETLNGKIVRRLLGRLDEMGDEPDYGD